MKSGPTLAEPTATPRRRRAAMRPVATVVLPTPEWVPATTSRGPRSSVLIGRSGGRGCSVLDALLGANAPVVDVLHLAHLGHGVGQLDQRWGGIAPGDHHVGVGGPLRDPLHDVVGLDPAVG